MWWRAPVRALSVLWYGQSPRSANARWDALGSHLVSPLPDDVECLGRAERE